MGSGAARAGLKGCRWGPARTSSDVSGEGPQGRSPGARAALASRLPKCTRSDGSRREQPGWEESSGGRGSAMSQLGVGGAGEGTAGSPGGLERREEVPGIGWRKMGLEGERGR